ncbi:GspH/FimT family pseudopilin [Zobellella sp. DQSA1]|uniref:GspH/FimT family pseudopilin n=1 Tax=Zobellella sp. DQSA1 TaxID=3342386 RepID=UPI0035C26395
MRIRTWSVGSKGFTLLELLVVLTISTLALAVALPRFAALLPGAELKSYSRQTAALLRLARSQAIATGEEVALLFDREARQTLLTGRPAPYPWPERIELVLSAVTDSPPAPQEMTFYPDGTSSGGTLVVAGSGQRYRIEVHWLTGRVSFHD